MGDANNAFMRDQSVQARTKAQNRATVLQLKLIGQSHPTGLTPNLLKLFEPRPPLEYKPPPERRKCLPLSGMSQFVGRFAEPGDPEYAPPVPVVETPTQKKERIHKIRLEKGAQTAAEGLEKYDPSKDPNATGDPYKTLFVARLSYETSENKLKREFEAYGPIKKVSFLEHRRSGAQVVGIGMGKVLVVSEIEALLKLDHCKMNCSSICYAIIKMVIFFSSGILHYNGSVIMLSYGNSYVFEQWIPEFVVP